MAYLRACQDLTGVASQVKTYGELNIIAKESNNAQLSFQSFICQLSTLFWMRQYEDLVELAEKYQPSKHMRSTELMRVFYEGIAYLNLARSTKQSVWLDKGKHAAAKVSRLEHMNKWNYENKSKLLQAELHYVSGELDMAKAAYKASIKAAAEHKFPSEEALGHELYGYFCIENGKFDEGKEELLIAQENYKKWGAIEKVQDVSLYIGLRNLALI